MDEILEVDEVQYDTGLIEPPSLSGGKFLKLKREFIFANMDLTVSEQRVLFNAMSLFDAAPFLENSEVWSIVNAEGYQDFKNLTPRVFDWYYWTHELRTIMLPMSQMIKLTGTRNYAALDKAIDVLHGKTVVMNYQGSAGQSVEEKLTMIERSKKVTAEDGTCHILITFTQAFMPYVVAFYNYDKLSMESLGKLKNKYSYRYMQWFYARLLGKKEAELYVTVDQIRKRFQLESDSHKQHFVKRIVQDPVNELTKITGLDVQVHAERNTSKRGKPIERFKFKIKRKVIEESDVEPPVQQQKLSERPEKPDPQGQSFEAMFGGVFDEEPPM